MALFAPFKPLLTPLPTPLLTPRPAMPALRAAPSQTAPPIISAPVPTRTVPPVQVPAMPPALVDELRFLQDAEAISSHTDAVKASGCRFGTCIPQGATRRHYRRSGEWHLVECRCRSGTCIPQGAT